MNVTCVKVFVFTTLTCVQIPVPDLGLEQVCPDLDLCAGVPDLNLRQVFLTLTVRKCS
jgi:hypothetical protein